jgi:hypothetical protein
MWTNLKLLAGGAVSVALVAGAMWAWQRAPFLWDDATRPEVAAWAIRSAAGGAIAAAQVLLLGSVVGGLFHKRMLDQILRVTACIVLAVCLVSAAALGLAAR